MGELMLRLKELGEGINILITGPETLYAIYFIVFLFGTYALFNNLFQRKVKLFRGKPGKVISFMVAVISTGAIFYGSTNGEVRGMKELLYLFNGFGGFILLLAFGVGIFFACFASYKKYKEESKNVGYAFLFGGIYLGSSMLKTTFISSKILNKGLAGTDAVVGYMGYFQPNLSYSIYMLLDYTALISGVLVLVYLFLVITGLFGSSDSSSISSSSVGRDKKSDAHAKRVSDFKGILNILMIDLKGANIHFNNKVNILNDLRVEIGRLRDLDEGGRR